MPGRNLDCSTYICCAVHQWSPTFLGLAPGTGFVEDNFSTDGRVLGGGYGPGGNATYGDGWGAADEALLARRLPAAHLLLCSPVPNRPRTGTGPWPRVWGPLLYVVWQRLFIRIYFLFLNTQEDYISQHLLQLYVAM